MSPTFQGSLEFGTVLKIWKPKILKIRITIRLEMLDSVFEILIVLNTYRMVLKIIQNSSTI